MSLRKRVKELEEGLGRLDGVVEMNQKLLWRLSNAYVLLFGYLKVEVKNVQAVPAHKEIVKKKK